MTDVRWRGQTHETLYNWINSGPGSHAAVPQLEYWQGLKGSLDDVSTRLHDQLAKVGASWQGQAGQTAHAGMTPMKQWAEAAHNASEVMRQSAQDQADHIANARAQMPEPVPPTTGAPSAWAIEGAKEAAAQGNMTPALAIAKQAADHEQQEAASASASERAVQVMNLYQAASEHNAATLAQFFAPPGVTVQVGDAVITSGAGFDHGHRAPDGMPTGPQGVLQHGPDAGQYVPFDGSTSAAGGAHGGPSFGGGGSQHIPLGSAENYNAAAADTLGAGAMVGGLGSQLLPKIAPGGFTGAIGGRTRDGRDQERSPGGRTTAAADPTGGTANTTNAAGAQGGVNEPGMTPGGAPMGGGGGAGGMGADTTRGGNPYLANRGLAGNNDPLSPPAEGGHSGTSSVDPSGHHGDQQGNQGGAQGGAGHGQALQARPGAGYAAPDMGMGAGGMGAPPPPMGGGAPMGGGEELQLPTGSSYLVQADNVFDDGDDVRVAPPVIGESHEQ